MLPQLGAGGCCPSPRNDRLASAITAAAMASVACTMSGATMFGRMWRSAMRRCGLPSARAASTYSSVFAASTWARVRRTNTGVAETPIAIMALERLGPRKAARAMARMRNGQASMASTMRESSASTQPPR